MFNSEEKENVSSMPTPTLRYAQTNNSFVRGQHSQQNNHEILQIQLKQQQSQQQQQQQQLTQQQLQQQQHQHLQKNLSFSESCLAEETSTSEPSIRCISTNACESGQVVLASISQAPRSVKAVKFEGEVDKRQLSFSGSTISIQNTSQSNCSSNFSSDLRATDWIDPMVEKYSTLNNNNNNHQHHQIEEHSFRVPDQNPSMADNDHQSPLKQPQISDISLKILNEILNSPLKNQMLSETKKPATHSFFELSQNKKQTTPYTMKAVLQNQEGQRGFFESEFEVTPQKKRIRDISVDIQEYRKRIETLKTEIHIITSKISNKPNEKKINSILEVTLSYQCRDTSKQLEKISLSLSNEQKQLGILQSAQEKHRIKIAGLQSRLEIIKVHKDKYFTLRETKIQDANEDFEKRRSQYQEQINSQEKELDASTHAIAKQEEDYNLLLEIKSFLKEDLNGRLIQRAEMVAEKEDLEAIYDQFREQYTEEFQYLEEIARLETLINSVSKQLTSNKKDEKSYSSEKEYIQTRLNDTQQYLQHFISKRESLQELVSTEKSHSSLLLSAMEAAISIAAQQFSDFPSIDTICYSFLKVKQVPTDVSSRTPTQSTVSLFLETLKDQSNESLLVQFTQHIRRTYFDGVNSNKIDEIIWSIRNLFLGLTDFEEISERHRKESEEIQSQISRYKGEEDSLLRELAILNSRITYSQTQYVNDSEIIRKSQQAKLVLVENLKTAVKKQSEIIFTQYCEDQRDNFNQIAETNGLDQVDFLMKDHSEQFMLLMLQQQQERIKQMSSIRSAKENLQKGVNENIRHVEQEILVQLKQLVVQIQQEKQRLLASQQELLMMKKRIESTRDDLKDLNLILQQKLNDIDSNLKVQISDIHDKLITTEAEIRSDNSSKVKNESDIKLILTNIEALMIQVIRISQFHFPFFIQKYNNKKTKENNLKQENRKAEEKKKLMKDATSNTTAKSQICNRQIEIEELEKKISKLQVSKMILENESSNDSFSGSNPSSTRNSNHRYAGYQQFSPSPLQSRQQINSSTQLIKQTSSKSFENLSRNFNIAQPNQLFLKQRIQACETELKHKQNISKRYAATPITSNKSTDRMMAIIDLRFNEKSPRSFSPFSKVLKSNSSVTTVAAAGTTAASPKSNKSVQKTTNMSSPAAAAAAGKVARKEYSPDRRNLQTVTTSMWKDPPINGTSNKERDSVININNLLQTSRSSGVKPIAVYGSPMKRKCPAQLPQAGRLTQSPIQTPFHYNLPERISYSKPKSQNSPIQRQNWKS